VAKIIQKDSTSELLTVGLQQADLVVVKNAGIFAVNYAGPADSNTMFRGNGDFFWELIAGFMPKLNAPVLALTVNSSTAITADWLAVTGATGYVLERATQSDFSNASVVYSGALLTFQSTGLTEGVTYYFRLRAEATGYADSASDTDSVATTNAVPTVSSSAALTSATIRVIFSEAVTSTVAGWSFKQNGATITPDSVTGSGTTTLVFTFSETLLNTDTFLRSYNSATGACLDAIGNELASFTDQAVTNSI
jgi:hypothetical protein